MGEKFDKPEVWLALHSFLVAFVWEMFQMPFYEMGASTAWQVTTRCALASFGDAGVMVFAYSVATLIARNRQWLHHATWKPLMAFLLTGEVITIAVEFVALRVPWGWNYSARMPVLWGIGLIPIAMWLVVPLAALRLAAPRTPKTAGDSASMTG
ncbi:MAG: hypothetical protein GW855_14540 [Erythrobacter sp.]|nr:hypothetical protein [Erythrobacter sp.]NCQ64185.1 hypothetical protein [Alphaproteobacteria bacterium]